VVACRSAEQKPSAEPPRIEVRADRRVELITILQRLVGEREYTRALDIAYVREVDAHFAPFKDQVADAMARNAMISAAI
jgi:hypothetical protein